MRGLAVSMALGACIMAAACSNPWATSSGPWQGWSNAQRDGWYAGSQGSRLIPESWFRALERPGSQALFADKAYLVAFGLIDPGPPFNLPIGFALDRQDDTAFKVTGLRWYAGQRGGKNDAERWVGLNCAACHTAEFTYRADRLRVDGGPSNFDFQAFIEMLNRALVETRDDPARFDRFAARVLGPGKDNAANREALRKALAQLVAWQEDSERRNFASDLPVPRYGRARVDAFGHIYNKVSMFAGNPDGVGNPASAPVSYPFLWDIDKQKQVQWNGIVDNQRIKVGNRNVLDYGAMGRNSGEVLGVFGELITVPNPSRLDGYQSSLNATNLNRMENLVGALQAPKWPSFLPFAAPIDGNDKDSRGHDELVARGAQVYIERKCQDCHTLPKDQVEGQPTERMTPFNKTPAAEQTDIWMACNAFTYSAPTARLENVPEDYFSGKPLTAEAPVGTMLAVSVKGALVGKKAKIVHAALENLFGVKRPPEIEAQFDDLSPEQRREARRQLCLEYQFPAGQKNILAYKARPLDGIWATAPYLHNGSVPTLYHLLLPASKRPKSFWVGSREFEPGKVGYIWDRKTGPNDFEFNTRDAAGKVIEGNSNAGHEYGVGSLTEADRKALLEYLKTL